MCISITQGTVIKNQVTLENPSADSMGESYGERRVLPVEGHAKPEDLQRGEN